MKEKVILVAMNDREKKTLSKMLRIYCRFKHEQRDSLCSACKQLENYAHQRLEHCKFGEKKTPCRKCPVHCYQPEYREKIKKVMQSSGQKMLFFHPADAIRHLWQTKF